MKYIKTYESQTNVDIPRKVKSVMDEIEWSFDITSREDITGWLALDQSIGIIFFLESDKDSMNDIEIHIIWGDQAGSIKKEPLIFVRTFKHEPYEERYVADDGEEVYIEDYTVVSNDRNFQINDIDNLIDYVNGLIE